MTTSRSIRTWTWLLALLVLADLIYSFIQFGRFPLDGDIASVVVPSEAYQRVLSDPFGFGLWKDFQPYFATNRYFAHASMQWWFLHAPDWFRPFADPVDAVYAACSLIKLIVQLSLLFFLSSLVAGNQRVTSSAWIAAAFCIEPLFQNYGFNTSMGVIDRAITYTCFYALPSAFIAGYILLQRRWTARSRMSRVLLLLLPVIMAFQGPLSPAIGCLLGGAHLMERWMMQKQGWTDRPLLRGWSLSWAWWFVLSCYSLWLGSFNAENPANGPSLIGRYGLLLQGLTDYFFSYPSLIVVLSVVLVSYVHAARKEMLTKEVKYFFTASGLLVLAYLLLLPFGGYRTYRPLIVRIDTLQPVMLWLFGWFGFFASRLLIAFIRTPATQVAGAGVLVVILYFTIADASLMKLNREERRYLHQLMQASQPVVQLPDDQPVMGWWPNRNLEESRLNCMLLNHWGVIPADRRYFQASGPGK